MKKIFCIILLCLDVLTFLVLCILSQFIIKVDAVTGVTTDGFGRILSNTPWILRMAGMHEWPGVKWFIVDSICGWLLIGIAYILFMTIEGDREK